MFLACLGCFMNKKKINKKGGHLKSQRKIIEIYQRIILSIRNK